MKKTFELRLLRTLGMLFTCALLASSVAGQDIAASIARLTDANVEVRRNAAEELATIGPDARSAVPALIERLNDADVRVRANSVRALGKIQQPADHVVPALIEALNDGEWPVRYNASICLTWLGPLAIPALEQSVKDTRAFARLYGADTLFRIDPTKAKLVVPVAIGLLEDKEEGVRAMAAQTIGLIGAPAAAAVPALIPLLQDKSQAVQTSAIGALGAIGRAAKEAVVPLAALLSKENKAAVRVGAATSLSHIGEAPELWVPATIAMFQPTHEEVVPGRAQVALARLGAPAVPYLIKALQHDEGIVRGFAAETLAQIGQPAAASVPELLVCLADSQWSVRGKAAVALGIVGTADEKVVNALKNLSKDPEELVRLQAEEAVARLTNPKK